jgi:hypothetical protein
MFEAEPLKDPKIAVGDESLTVGIVAVELVPLVAVGEAEKLVGSEVKDEVVKADPEDVVPDVVERVVKLVPGDTMPGAVDKVDDDPSCNCYH